MSDKEYISLEKMIEYIKRAKRYTAGYTYETFTEDEKTIDATVFAISQIGELVRNISKNLIEKYDFIEWNMIKGLRNRIVHDYEGISLKSIWYVINNDLNALEDDIRKIIALENNKKEE